MKRSNISKENELAEMIDFSVCKKLVAVHRKQKRKDEICILLGHYSINIQSKFNDGEQLQWDLEELEDFLGCEVFVSQYDDLCCNPFHIEHD